MNSERNLTLEYTTKVAASIREEYTVDKKMVTDEGVKRGLRNPDGTGVLAGITRIGSVQGYYVKDGMRIPEEGKLFYRGIDVDEILEANRKSSRFGYEEVVYLILMGKLPNENELLEFKEVIAGTRIMPPRFNEDVIFVAPSNNVMNKLASSILALYAYDADPDNNSLENMLRISVELIGRLPIIVANAHAVKRHHFREKSLYIHKPLPQLSLAENFMRMIRKDKQYTDQETRILDAMLVMHAEHGGGNNSTFVCRALASTGTDTYSVIAGAVGSLKGPLHGGANEKVMEMFGQIKENVADPSNDSQLRDYLDKQLSGEVGDRSKKIYGIGHAVYTLSDPRAVMIKKFARELTESNGEALADLELMESIERIGIPLIMERKKQNMPLCANVDMYSGLVYGMLGIPQELYTPLFTIARISGWCAHRIEEELTGGRIMRPAYRAAVNMAPYVPIEKR